VIRHTLLITCSINSFEENSNTPFNRRERHFSGAPPYLDPPVRRMLDRRIFEGVRKEGARKYTDRG